MTCKATMTTPDKDDAKLLPPFPAWVTPSTRCNSCKGCKIMSRPQRYYSSELKEWFRTCSKCLAKRRVRRAKEKNGGAMKQTMEEDEKMNMSVCDVPRAYSMFDTDCNQPTGSHHMHDFSMATTTPTTVFGTPAVLLPTPKLKEYRDAMGNVLKPTTLSSPVFLGGDSVFNMREEVQRSFQQSALALTTMYNNAARYAPVIPPPVVPSGGGDSGLHTSRKRFRSQSAPAPIAPIIASPREMYSLSECDTSMQPCEDMLFDLFQDMD